MIIPAVNFAPCFNIVVKNKSVPDAETGLVRCGCGGKAEHEDFEDIFFKLSRVSCPKCGIVITTGRGKAKDAWNKAMGGKGGG